jgi:hypothetical protein
MHATSCGVVAGTVVKLMVQPLDIGEYRNAYEPGKVECASTGEIRPMEEIIG